MRKLYDLAHSEEWDGVVRSFAEYDVYYLSGYAKGFHIHGDGDPFLMFYEGDGLRAICVYMKRATVIEGYYDSVTPYGYGGVLFEGEKTDANLQAFRRDFLELMETEHIVDGFVRYHPVLNNAAPMRRISTVFDLGRTIAFDLSSPGLIWENITSKNRNMIRKAEKNGIEIHHGKGLDLLMDFKRVYDTTMDKKLAEAYFYFEDAFYESIHHDLSDNYEVFYAVLNGVIIAVGLMLFANHQMHYHLAGSLNEYRSLAPSNLLLYEAALWGFEQGFKTFHLGGGVGSAEDDLFKFKAAFNKKSDYQFSIGKQVYNQEMYDQLVEIRRATDPSFNADSLYFPLYRA